MCVGYLVGFFRLEHMHIIALISLHIWAHTVLCKQALMAKHVAVLSKHTLYVTVNLPLCCVLVLRLTLLKEFTDI